MANKTAATPQQKLKLTFTVAETAGALGLSEAYVRKLIAGGIIASVRFGKRVMVRKSELERVAAAGVA
jgi:excisionase family DNA binding protein